MLIDAPSTLLNTIIHKEHLSHFMAKTMNELAHKSPLICIAAPKLWNLLSSKIRNSRTLNNFKNTLKWHLFRLTFINMI